MNQAWKLKSSWLWLYMAVSLVKQVISSHTCSQLRAGGSDGEGDGSWRSTSRTLLHNVWRRWKATAAFLCLVVGGLLFLPLLTSQTPSFPLSRRDIASVIYHLLQKNQMLLHLALRISKQPMWFILLSEGNVCDYVSISQSYITSWLKVFLCYIICELL